MSKFCSGISLSCSKEEEVIYGKVLNELLLLLLLQEYRPEVVERINLPRRHKGKTHKSD